MLTWEGPGDWRCEETDAGWVYHPTGNLNDACLLLRNMIDQGYIVTWGLSRIGDSATAWLKVYESQQGEPPWPSDFQPTSTGTHDALGHWQDRP